MKTSVWLDLNECVFVCVGRRLTWRRRLSLLHRRHTAHASSLSLSILLAFSDFIAAGLQKNSARKMVIVFTFACLNVM